MIKIAEFELLKFSYDNVIEETNYFSKKPKISTFEVFRLF